MRALSLFSGIGGFDLALEAAPVVAWIARRLVAVDEAREVVAA